VIRARLERVITEKAVEDGGPNEEKNRSSRPTVNKKPWQRPPGRKPSGSGGPGMKKARAAGSFQGRPGGGFLEGKIVRGGTTNHSRATIRAPRRRGKGKHTR